MARKPKTKQNALNVQLPAEAVLPTVERRKRGPVAETHVASEGKPVKVYKALTGIEIMHRNGTISFEEFSAAQEFQTLFLIANRSDVTGINLNGAGGAMGKEEIIDRKIDAARRIDEMYLRVGGPKTLPGRALRYIVGQDWTLSQMIKAFGHGAHYWRGALISALQILSTDHKLPERKQKLVAKTFELSNT